jgi:hypothetical protein
MNMSIDVIKIDQLAGKKVRIQRSLVLVFVLNHIYSCVCMCAFSLFTFSFYLRYLYHFAFDITFSRTMTNLNIS